MRCPRALWYAVLAICCVGGVVRAQVAPDANACAMGDQDLAASKWSDAISAYQVCVQSNKSFAVYSNMGVAFTHLGRMEEAVASYDQALALDPTNSRVEFNLAVALVKEGSYERAADHLRHLDKTGTDSRYDELLALCYFHLGSYGLAQRAAERVYAEHPEDAGNALILGSIYTRTGQYDKALPLITLALKAAGSTEGHMILAQTLIGMHRYPEARTELEQVSAMQPDLPGLHEAMGEVLVGTEHPQQAEGEFAAALRENPNDFEANYFLGRLKRFDGDLSAANLYLNAAERLQPGSPQVSYERAEIAVKQLRFADAVPLLERVIQADPDQAQAYLLLAEAYQRTGRRQDAQREGELYNQKRRSSREKVDAAEHTAQQENP